MKQINSALAGIGLRTDHYQALRDLMPPLGFVEVHSENYFGDGGAPLDWLDWFAARYPVSLHGVGLSLGSTDPIDREHIRRLKRLIDRVQPALVSDHLCWIGAGGRFANDLLPMPFTLEALQHVATRIDNVQQSIGRAMLIENVSSYMTFAHSSIPECEFISALAQKSGCRILLDINNIYVNSVNHGLDAIRYIDNIPVEAIAEIHLAGFQDRGDILIDTHGDRVAAPVWQLYEHAIKRFGAVPTLIEWDTDIPSLPVLLDEATTATVILGRHAIESEAQHA